MTNAASTVAQATSELESISQSRAIGLSTLAFAQPLITSLFLLLGPYGPWQALLCTVPIWILVLADLGAGPERRHPSDDRAAWPFDVQIHALFGLQVLNHLLLGFYAARLAGTTIVRPGAVASTADILCVGANLAAVIVIAGTTAGSSGIIVAHELIHRRNPVDFQLGRFLLTLVLHEHFATEHVRGHHPRVGTAEDPATARFGETVDAFLGRSSRGQLVSAWRLERIRQGLGTAPAWDRRWLGHRVLQGFVGEALILAGYFHLFGALALLFFVVQARTAVILLDVVNYIEHWGLTREGEKITLLESWDTDNRFTLHALLGLSRHSDHHVHVSRPHQKLLSHDDTAKMPFGYYGTILMALFSNERYRRAATAELRRRRLGPFRPSPDGVGDLGC